MKLDFAYPWWLAYGHLAILIPAAALLALGWTRRWSRLFVWPLAAVVLWSAVAFFATRFLMDINGRASLPTQNFLRSGTGRVLDMGAGTGRSSIMVLEQRPQTTLVALDLFGRSYEQHFGPDTSPQQRLRTISRSRTCRSALPSRSAICATFPLTRQRLTRSSAPTPSTT